MTMHKKYASRLVNKSGGRALIQKTRNSSTAVLRGYRLDASMRSEMSSKLLDPKSYDKHKVSSGSPINDFNGPHKANQTAL